jgi:hypothetical protein
VSEVKRSRASVYRAKNAERYRAIVRDKRRAHPERLAAHDAVKWALSTSKLTRPDHCSVCGKDCKPEGHHDDYSKPLDVRWLCRACHFAHHGIKIVPKTSVSGEYVGTSKLQADQVLQIRRLSGAGLSQRAIAKQFGIDQSTVSDIVRRERWKHL